MKRLVVLDALRGVAALGVILWHWQHFQGNPKFIELDEPLRLLFVIPYKYAWLSVDCFFSISGYVFYAMYYDKLSTFKMSIKEFWVKRFARIFPLHALTLIAVFILQQWHRKSYGTWFVFSGNELSDVPANLFLLSAWIPSFLNTLNQPIWSVSVEFLLYIVFCLLATARAGGKFGTLIWIVIGYAIVYPLNGLIGRGLGAFFIGGGLYWVRVQSFGRRFEVVFRALSQLACVGIVVAMLVISLANAFGLISLGSLLEGLDRNVVYAFVLIVMIPSFVYSSVCEYSLGARLGGVLKFLGDISFGIYLWHFPVQILIVILFGESRWFAPVFSSWIGLVGFYLVIILLAHVMYVRFEVPLRRFAIRYFIN